jgi:hypothetical protein
MEEKNNNIKEKKKGFKFRSIFLLILIILVIILIIIGLFKFTSKKGKITVNIKSSLEKIVEKSDLETATFTYNLVAKKCKDDNNCDIESNKMANFKYVVSCKGSVTAGLDFSKIIIKEDKSNKKIIVTLPDTAITSKAEISTINFINGDDLPADTIPEARKLCQETIENKSNEDDKLLETAKNQAEIVLEEYYKQWIKTYDSSYKVEFN